MRRFLNVTLIVAMLAGGACAAEAAPPPPAESAKAAPTERLVPTFAHGVLIGFKVFAMKPGSRYLESGFQAGDTIVAIDGEAITRAEDGAKIDAGLEKNGVVRLTVSRKGVKLASPLELRRR